MQELIHKHGAPMLVYLLCRALGLTQGEAAARAGFSRQAGSRREQDPCWPGALAAMQARLVEIDPILLPLLPDAYCAYQSALADGDKTLARDVIDRAFGKPGTRTTHKSTGGALPPLIVYERIDPD